MVVQTVSELLLGGEKSFVGPGGAAPTHEGRRADLRLDFFGDFANILDCELGVDNLSVHLYIVRVTILILKLVFVFVLILVP
jgi:hypothetical protein